MYRNGPSTPPCGTPLPGVTDSVQPFPVATMYLLQRRYFPAKSTYGRPSCRHIFSMSLCGMLGNAPFTSTDAINASRSSSLRYMLYRKLASCVDLPGTDPDMVSGMTPAAYSRCCILRKITIHTSLASVTAQHMGSQFPGLK